MTELVGVGNRCVQCDEQRVYTEPDDQNEDRTGSPQHNRWPGSVNGILNDNRGQAPGNDTSGSSEAKVSETTIHEVVVI